MMSVESTIYVAVSGKNTGFGAKRNEKGFPNIKHETEIVCTKHEAQRPGKLRQRLEYVEGKASLTLAT